MFSVEIEFRDGISHPETVFVQRTSAVIGASDRAHVVIEGAGSGIADIQILRGLGRNFSCYNISRSTVSENQEQTIVEGTHSGSVDFKYGNLSLLITALDLDLLLTKDESPDRGAVRVLRKALSSKSNVYPAVAIVNSRPLYVSFGEEKPLTIGRLRGSDLRLEASDISGEHARIGYENNSFWIEDLGSTNGTFIDDVKISGRRSFSIREQVRVGADTTLVPILSQDDIVNFQSLVQQSNSEQEVLLSKVSYPCLIASSKSIRPQNLYIESNSTVTIGRDPANDVWVSASHISREHLQISRDDSNTLTITDCSSNGSYLNGDKLVMGQAVSVEQGPLSLDLCSGIEFILYLNQGENPEASKILEMISEEVESESLQIEEKIDNDKLNEANLSNSPASEYFEMPHSEKNNNLSEFEKYQKTYARNPVVDEQFDGSEEFEDDLSDTNRKDLRSLFLLALFVLLVAVLCVVIFTS